jgi:O-antigen/teichoic acid export membrane protein
LTYPTPSRFQRGRDRIRRHLADRQHANAYYLMAGNLVAAAAGLAFWFLLAAVLGLAPAVIGLGYAIFSLGTLVGVVAKGGLDTALVRSVPEAGRSGGLSLFVFALVVGSVCAALVSFLVVGVSSWTGAGLGLGLGGWILVGLIGVLLVVTWLQDAYFVGEGDARYCFHRNAVLSVARVVLPVPVVLLVWPHPVALSWGLALALSAAVAFFFMWRMPQRQGRLVPRMEFVKRSLRNVTGTAAEFLPGYLLVPVILALRGPEEAGFFAIAWTAASLLFVASAASGRSALSQIVRDGGPHRAGAAVRKGVRQHVLLLLPAAVVGIVFAPLIMGIFGPAYAQEATWAFRLLCVSILFVGPTYLYLALLRAQDRPWILTVFPFVMMLALFALAPPYAALLGVTGVALVWLVANIPFGVWGAWMLWRATRVAPSSQEAPGHGANRSLGVPQKQAWRWTRRSGGSGGNRPVYEVDE